MSKNSAFCLATSRDQANRIVDQLKVATFSNNDISVLFPDKGMTRYFAHEKNTEGIAVGAGTGGGIAGGLIGMGIPELEAKRYAGKVNVGNLLISVHTENSEEISRAKEIFTNAGAQDICTTCTTGEAPAPESTKASEHPTVAPTFPLRLPFAGRRV